MQRAHDEGRLVYTKSGAPRYKRYLDEMPGRVVTSMWDDIPFINSQAQERLGYPTQKPLALLDRIITASSNSGDMALDPFCGCATTCVAAERLGRQWVGIDISEKAVDLGRVRIRKEVDTITFGQVRYTFRAFDIELFYRSDIPKRTDQPIIDQSQPQSAVIGIMIPG